jgi:hypothetical protein
VARAASPRKRMVIRNPPLNFHYPFMKFWLRPPGNPEEHADGDAPLAFCQIASPLSQATTPTTWPCIARRNQAASRFGTGRGVGGDNHGRGGHGQQHKHDQPRQREAAAPRQPAPADVLPVVLVHDPPCYGTRRRRGGFTRVGRRDGSGPGGAPPPSRAVKGRAGRPPGLRRVVPAVEDAARVRPGAG